MAWFVERQRRNTVSWGESYQLGIRERSQGASGWTKMAGSLGSGDPGGLPWGPGGNGDNGGGYHLVQEPEEVAGGHGSADGEKQVGLR